MKKLFSSLLVGTLMLSMVPLVTAGPKKPKKDKPTPEAVFKRLDKDKDGKLTMKEFVGKKKKKDAAEKQFKKRDKDGDGSLSLEEFTATRKKKQDKTE